MSLQKPYWLCEGIYKLQQLCVENRRIKCLQEDQGAGQLCPKHNRERESNVREVNEGFQVLGVRAAVMWMSEE